MAYNEGFWLHGFSTTGPGTSRGSEIMGIYMDIYFEFLLKKIYIKIISLV